MFQEDEGVYVCMGGNCDPPLQLQLHNILQKICDGILPSMLLAVLVPWFRLSTKLCK